MYSSVIGTCMALLSCAFEGPTWALGGIWILSWLLSCYGSSCSILSTAALSAPPYTFAPGAGAFRSYIQLSIFLGLVYALSGRTILGTSLFCILRMYPPASQFFTKRPAQQLLRSRNWVGSPGKFCILFFKFRPGAIDFTNLPIQKGVFPSLETRLWICLNMNELAFISHYWVK